jgi:aminoglycoside/choline kinase family phosphotransferase
MSLIHNQTDLYNFLREQHNIPGINLKSLKQEASQRDYYQVSFNDLNLTEFVISVNHQKINVSDDFCLIQKEFEKNRLPVPKIIRVDHEQGLIWQEDLGSEDLFDILEKNSGLISPEVEKYYKRSLDCLVSLKNIKPVSPIKERFFDREKLQAELYFLTENANRHLTQDGLPVDNNIYSEWKTLCVELDIYKTERICHRDFHSRNIKIKNEAVYLIDFQDARMGSRYYDLASLLYDPYVNLPESFRDKLFGYYHTRANENVDLRAFQSQVIQRLLKALGTYIYQVYEKDNKSYKAFIQPTLKRLEGLLGEFPEHVNMPYTKKWISGFLKCQKAL